MQSSLGKFNEAVIGIEALQPGEELVDHLRHGTLPPVDQLLDGGGEGAIHKRGALLAPLLASLASAPLPVLRSE